MKADELKNELDRKRAEREERRNRVRTYKDKPREVGSRKSTGSPVSSLNQKENHYELES